MMGRCAAAVALAPGVDTPNLLRPNAVLSRRFRAPMARFCERLRHRSSGENRASHAVVFGFVWYRSASLEWRLFPHAGQRKTSALSSVVAAARVRPAGKRGEPNSPPTLLSIKAIAVVSRVGPAAAAVGLAARAAAAAVTSACARASRSERAAFSRRCLR